MSDNITNRQWEECFKQDQLNFNYAEEDRDIECTEVMEIMQEMFADVDISQEDGELSEGPSNELSETPQEQLALLPNSLATEEGSQATKDLEKRGSSTGGRDRSGFDDGVREAIFTPPNARTAHIYSAAAKDFLELYEENRFGDIKEEANFCNYFHRHVHLEKQFGIGSIWNKYSCINNFMKKEHGVDLNTYRELRTFMTNMTCKYVPKKSGTLTLGQFKTLLARFRRKMKEMGSDPDMRLYYVASCVLWFGLLQGKE